MVQENSLRYLFREAINNAHEEGGAREAIMLCITMGALLPPILWLRFLIWWKGDTIGKDGSIAALDGD